VHKIHESLIFHCVQILKGFYDKTDSKAGKGQDLISDRWEKFILKEFKED